MQNKHKTIAYLRISTSKQDLDKDKIAILNFANERDLGQVQFIKEMASGTISWKKRKIAEIVDSLEKGDHFIVSEISRIGRSMLEIMQVLAFFLEKEINVYSIKGNWELNNSLQSKVMAMAFSMVAEIERELISKRTKEALRAKKAAGVQLGRPKGTGKSKLDKFRPEIEALLNNGSTQKFIAHRYNTTESNLHHWMRKHGVKRKRTNL